MRGTLLILALASLGCNAALDGDRLGLEVRGGSIRATMQGESRDLGPMPADAACVAWAGGGRARAEARWPARPRVRVVLAREEDDRFLGGVLASVVAAVLDRDDNENDATVGEAAAEREKEERRRRHR